MQPKNLKHLHPNVPYQNKMFIKLLHKKRAENCITLDEKIEIEKPNQKCYCRETSSNLGK